MKIKAFILALLGLLLLSAAGYWIYNRFSQNDIPLRALVPTDAVLVYTNTQPEVAWDSLQQHTFGQLLKDLPAFERLRLYEQDLKKLLPSFESLREREFLFSLHITERHGFDYLLLMPFKGTKDLGLLKELRSEIEGGKAYKLSERNYMGIQLYEVSDLQKGGTFSFFVKDGVLAGSFTSFLAEAAIRRVNEWEQEPAATWLSNPDGSVVMETLGSITINQKQLPALLRIFAGNDSLVQELVPRLPYFSRLDALTAPEGVLLTGFTYPENAEEEDFLWSLHGQQPQKMRLDYLVPLRTASLLFVGLSRPQEWHKRQRSYWQKKAPEQWERWQVLEAKAPEAAKLATLFGKEIGLATIPAVGAAAPDRLLILQLSDSTNAALQLRDLVAHLAKGDTLYSESFLKQQLQELPYQEFPASLLGSAFLGFEESYFTIIEDYLVISSSIPALKDMLLDMRAEETWQRSVRLNRFISRLDTEQNYALYLNTAAFWPLLYKRLSQPWQQFWDKHGVALQQVDLLSLQLSAAEGAFYTNLFLHLDPRPERQLEQIRLAKQAATQFSSRLVHAPVAVGYRLQRSGHWMVQDSARSLHLVAATGEIVRSRNIGGYWQQQLMEVDPQKNKNVFYFLTTPDSAYLLQPNLQSLSPFPLALPQDEKIAWSNVIDYDGSRRYRFLLASKKGNLHMFDLDGVPLEGWQPKQLQGALAAAPGHLRVRSKDIVYAFQQNGTVHAFTRKGAYFPGFPLNLGDSLLGPVHMRQGSDFKNTRFVTVTASGILLEWDLEGKILSRKQLYRPDIRARFYLVPDSRNKGFIIAQQDRFRLRLLDETGGELFEKDYLGASRLNVQYFSFADAASLVAVTDPDQEFTYLYDLKGTLLQTQPLNSCCPVELQRTSTGDTLRLVKGFNNAVEQYTLPVINSSN